MSGFVGHPAYRSERRIAFRESSWSLWTISSKPGTSAAGRCFDDRIRAFLPTPVCWMGERSCIRRGGRYKGDRRRPRVRIGVTAVHAPCPDQPGAGTERKAPLNRFIRSLRARASHAVAVGLLPVAASRFCPRTPAMDAISQRSVTARWCSGISCPLRHVVFCLAYFWWDRSARAWNTLQAAEPSGCRYEDKTGNLTKRVLRGARRGAAGGI